MSLEACFKEIPPKPIRCQTCIWYTELDVQDRAFFDQQSRGDKTRLWKACSKAGLESSYSAFREHLNNEQHVGRGRNTPDDGDIL